MAFLARAQLEAMGFAGLGEDVLISDAARIYNAAQITIGSHVRIDDFCILSAGSGGIHIGKHIHISCFTSLIGKESIRLGDFASLSTRVSVFSSSDDYSGEFMANPTVPERFRRVQHGAVSISRHAIIGSGSIILPGVTVGEGASAGAMTLIAHDLDAFAMYVGIPARKTGERKRDLLALEKKLGA